ncbi:MAG: T9SS type A sorting domain-containing protein [Bacteroidales bacterium]|nr:T9SS type A sorting domain-containing protein [Bacteroidales bacterium]
MKPNQFLSCLLLFAANFLFSQGCLPEGIEFLSQDEIDLFPTNYPGCTVIEGDVAITGFGIYNLDSLNVLTAIDGKLNISTDELTFLTGLENVTTIGGALEIKHCIALANLFGLENLVSLGGNLEIMNNPNLLNLSGLSNLTSIPGDLYVGLNTQLEDIKALAGVTSVGGNFTATVNPYMESLGLFGLQAVGGNFEVSTTIYLISMEDLAGLTSIGGDMIINSNYALTSLEGMHSINPASIENLEIKQNPALSECAVESICNYLASPGGTVDITFNGPGCDSIEEVISACLTEVYENSCTRAILLIPNPATDFVSISGFEDVEKLRIFIYDIYGNPVNRWHHEGNTLCVSSLKPGVYIVELKNKAERYSKKLIIK